MNRASLFALLVSLPFAMLGCGGGEEEDPVHSVHGTLTAAGAPLEVSGREAGIGLVELTFHRLDASGNLTDERYQASLDNSGDFNVPGPAGVGIPPGEYRIVVRQWDPYPQVDKLDGRFDESQSPLVYTIAGAERIEIDVAE